MYLILSFHTHFMLVFNKRNIKYLDKRPERIDYLAFQVLTLFVSGRNFTPTLLGVFITEATHWHSDNM